MNNIIFLFKSRRNRNLVRNCLTFAICFFTCLSYMGLCSAADFAGNLKGITITDYGNAPPASVITYSLDSVTPRAINFNATGSADTDGVLSQYKWDFGDQTTGSEPVIKHTYGAAGDYLVTLTVIDDKRAVAVSKQKIYAGFRVKDDFSTDTSSLYININGLLSVNGGVAHGKAWSRTITFHNTSVKSPDQRVCADVSYNGIGDSGGILVRFDNINQTGYVVYFKSGSIALGTINGTALTWQASYNGKYVAGVYGLKVEAEAGEIRVFVDGQKKIDKALNNYQFGNYAGIFIDRASNSDAVVDNLVAEPITQ